MTTLQILQKLITIDSQNQKSNKAIVDFMASFFPRRFTKITKLRKGDVNLYNLEVKYPGKQSGRPLIFSGHTDTVPVSNAWTIHPFKPQIKNNRIYGLGSTDMKSGLAAMITAAQSIKGVPARDVWFLFDADEEVGSTGGKDFMKRLKIKPGTAQVVVGEPTSGQLLIGQKGCVEIIVTVRGKSFHSSHTSVANNLKFNAIQKAAAMIKQLADLEKTLERKKDKLFGYACQSVCLVDGGTASNVIPDVCRFHINRRLLPSEDLSAVIGAIRKIILLVDKTAVLDIGYLGEANQIPANSELLTVASKVSRSVWGKAKTDIFTGWTQAGLFKKWGDCLIWGPGEFKMAHQANEYCPLGDLDKMVRCYTELIKQLK